MRYSLDIKTAALVLLGAETFFLGVSSAPLGVALGPDPVALVHGPNPQQVGTKEAEHTDMVKFLLNNSAGDLFLPPLFD
ncbi:hypothetical protein PG993_012427 [Apiospora rasikravindrae]|uniref:Uncharacterized protein n=1 Tax=Apiospora rasikravindrae TaxID=990691 RepID=A0ABR1S2I4_9PEZI